MKVRVSIDLELPDVEDNNVDLQSEYVPGMTWEMAYATQEVFDYFVNYAICRHLRDATKWMANKESPNASLIAQHHDQWADILRNAEPSMKVEKIS
mgnify:CR=1 FL=1